MTTERVRPPRAQTMPVRRADKVGAAWMVVAMVAYLINDTLMKLALESLPLFQAIFIRGAMISVLFGVIAWRSGGFERLRRCWERQLSLRVMCEMGATVLYLAALGVVPIANLNAIMQLAPVAVTFIAARLLRETLSWRRIGSVVAGFVGVVLIVRPGGADFSPWYIAGFAAMSLFVVREIATANVPHDLKSIDIAFVTAFAITVMGGVGAVAGDTAAVDVRSVALLISAAAFISVAYMASVLTVRSGDLSFSAPFRYAGLASAVILQILVFAETPDAVAFVGLGIIVAAGLFALSSSATPRPDPHPTA